MRIMLDYALRGSIMQYFRSHNRIILVGLSYVRQIHMNNSRLYNTAFSFRLRTLFAPKFCDLILCWCTLLFKSAVLTVLCARVT
jgi:hypothetical protein